MWRLRAVSWNLGQSARTIPSKLSTGRKVMFLYSIYDRKATQYGPVLMALNEGVMSRSVRETFEGTNHAIARWPEDFDLYQIAGFNQDSGETDRALKFICNLAVIMNNGRTDATGSAPER